MSAVDAYIALGSNLGDRRSHLARAARALRAMPGSSGLRLSPVYETAPLGPPPQGPYLNAVAQLRSNLAPRDLLMQLHAIERAEGRERGAVRLAPRTLDLDLLLYGTLRIDAADIVVPHPRLHERAFVLEPLRDLAPELLHPALGETVEALAARVRDPTAVRRAGVLEPDEWEAPWPSLP